MCPINGFRSSSALRHLPVDNLIDKLKHVLESGYGESIFGDSNNNNIR
jgi:hypothetical protein